VFTIAFSLALFIFPLNMFAARVLFAHCLAQHSLKVLSVLLEVFRRNSVVS
jgi:hypothetical protein